MSNESIITELLAELEALRKKQTNTESILVESLSEFKYEELADKLKIRGILLAEGVWNGLKYTWNNIKEMYNKFKDKLSSLPVKAEHEKTREYKGKTLGKIVRVKPNEFLKAIEYEADIVNPSAIKDIKNGRFKATSLKLETTRVVKDGEELATNLVPIDNSLTEYPACKPCQILNVEELSDYVNYYGIKLFKEKKHKIFRGEDMSEYLEVKENQILVFPDIPEEELFAEEQEVELTVMDEEEALARKRRVVKVPPGKYPKKAIKRKVIVYYYPGYGYYIPYGYYPVPYYYWYYYGYPIAKSELDELVYLEGEWKIVKNKKTGKFIVMRATGKKFPAWKIIGQFDTYEEAKETITQSELQLKCPVCGETFKSRDELLEHWSREHEEKYGPYGQYKPVKGSESRMEELAVRRCFICGQEVKSKADFLRHWTEKHEKKYGEYKKAKRLAEAIFTDKEFRKKIKKMLQELSEEPKEEETKAEEEAKTGETPSKEEEVPTEGERKEEEPKEAPKEEEKKEEVSKEEKPVEEIPVEVTPKEAYEAIKKEIGITAEVAADLLLKCEQEEEL